MKKKIALVLCLALAVSALATGCGAAKTVKTGLGIVTSQGSSKDASADADGCAQTDGTIAAVTVDESGKVVQCVIDCAQIKVNFSADGALVTNESNAELRSKYEKKDDYGMRGVSPIGAEWFEQADAFAAYCVGKTAAEIEAIAMTDGYVDDSVDLKASVTMHATDMQAAVLKAIAAATDNGAKSGDKLGLGITTSLSHYNADATADADGSAQEDTTIAVITTDSKGVVTSADVEAYQSKVTFDTTGVITSDLTATILTKTEKKEDYGMKGISPIGAEWYEQADFFEKYIVGKDLAAVQGIGIESGYPTDADLLAGTTIAITDLHSAVVKAINSAK